MVRSLIFEHFKMFLKITFLKNENNLILNVTLPVLKYHFDYKKKTYSAEINGYICYNHLFYIKIF
jgi:hypothetical protein